MKASAEWQGGYRHAYDVADAVRLATFATNLKSRIPVEDSAAFRMVNFPYFAAWTMCSSIGSTFICKPSLAGSNDAEEGDL